MIMGCPTLALLLAAAFVLITLAILLAGPQARLQLARDKLQAASYTSLAAASGAPSGSAERPSNAYR